MTKLGTGFRVNSAMDDAAGLQIATRLNAQSRGMQVAQKNTQNGISLLQTGEGALKEVSNILLRMKDLATESATATTSFDDRVALQAEFAELGKEMANIVGNTKFAGENVFVTSKSSLTTAGGKLGSPAGVTFQIGSSTGETMKMDLGNATTGSLSNMLTNLSNVSSQFSNTPADATAAVKGAAAVTAVAAVAATYAADAFTIATPAVAAVTASALVKETEGTELYSQGPARAMIDTINTALDSVGTVQSALGAAANRLEHTNNNLGNMITNTEATKGRIMDVDYATETSNMTSKQMLMQASTSMLKQSNSMSQMVASLLQ